MNVCLINYNTPELIDAAINSLLKHTSGCEITVFDNSDVHHCYEREGVGVIDNTSGQIINFDALLENFPNKLNNTANNFGSVKHSYTVQVLWDYFPNGFILMDSDVLVINDISELVDYNVACSGEIYCNKQKYHCKVPRLLPFLCWINVPFCKYADVSYFDPSRSWKIDGSKNPNDWYDTGASFVEDCVIKNLPIKKVVVSNYIIHFGKGSWKNKKLYKKWLEQNKRYWL